MCYKLPRNHTTECKGCKRRFKKVTEEDLCYGCHINKYGAPSKDWNPTGKYNG